MFPRLALILAAILSIAAESGSRSALTIDASKPVPAPGPLSFEAGGRSPDGRVLGINKRYLTLDGQPWLPVMGEFHFARYPADGWDEEILKMKAAGVSIVASYVFWIHHEEIEGQFDWSGQRNLRQFVEACKRHGMYFWLRVGPWAHGEARNGGLPDWVLKNGPVRQNDPKYLRSVERFYAEIGRQTKGLFWKDGGPIVGVQLENEYHEYGEGKGAAHILTLRKMAMDAGLVAPFYTITGWDNAAVPDRGVVPVFGGYPDAFWDRGITKLPPSPNYFFTRIRCEENVAPDLTAKRPEIDARFADYPFFTAEMGGGMELSYHRRALITGDDIAAMALVKLGAGVTMYGYYMYHGGNNPDGKLTTLHETQATGYPNDMRVESYDFQCPLGEFGKPNASYRDTKLLHLFLKDFGGILAPMTSSFPNRQPRDNQDRDTPRVAMRGDGSRGFLFINNYQRNHPLRTHKAFQVQVKLAAGTMAVPREPVEIPSGVHTIWPINLEVGGATLRYSTAQLLTKLDDPRTLVFYAWPGVNPEFAFDAAEGVSIEAPGSRVRREGGINLIDNIQPGPGVAVRIRTASGVTQLIVTTRAQARDVWKAEVAGRERLVLSTADLFFDKDAMTLRSTETSTLSFGVFPDSDKLQGFSKSGQEGVFERYTTRVTPLQISAKVESLAPAAKSEPVKVGAEVALAPTDPDFARAARWSIKIPDISYGAVSNVWLKLPYMGDVARLYAKDRLVTDDFYRGVPWEIGLRRLPSEMELKILPLRQDAPIYLPDGAKPSFPASGEALTLEKVTLIPEYQAVAKFKR